MSLGYRVDEWGYRRVFVEDRGGGIWDEEEKDMLEGLYKGERFREGGGLGLSMWERIVEGIEGRIRVS